MGGQPKRARQQNKSEERGARWRRTHRKEQVGHVAIDSERLEVADRVGIACDVVEHQWTVFFHPGQFVLHRACIGCALGRGRFNNAIVCGATAGRDGSNPACARSRHDCCCHRCCCCRRPRWRKYQRRRKRARRWWLGLHLVLHVGASGGPFFFF